MAPHLWKLAELASTILGMFLCLESVLSLWGTDGDSFFKNPVSVYQAVVSAPAFETLLTTFLLCQWLAGMHCQEGVARGPAGWGRGRTVLAPGFCERPVSSCPPQLPWGNPVEPVYGTGRHIYCPDPLRSQHQLSSDPSSASGPPATSSEFVRLSNSRVFPCPSVVRLVAVGSLHPSVACVPFQ